MSSAHDLAGVTRYFVESPEARRQHAADGAAYVAREYSWSAVLERFDAVVNAITADSHATPRESLQHE